MPPKSSKKKGSSAAGVLPKNFHGNSQTGSGDFMGQGWQSITTKKYMDDDRRPWEVRTGGPRIGT